MVIAALASFAVLLVAWILAPDQARTAEITDLTPADVPEPIAA